MMQKQKCFSQKPILKRLSALVKETLNTIVGLLDLSGNCGVERKSLSMDDIPQEACDIIKEFEGFRSEAYLCTGGKWTVGYGHTKQVNDKTIITKEEAEDFLREDVKEAANTVDRYVDVPLSSFEFAALVSFVFNVGAGNFKRSTLLKLLNKGFYEQVPIQLMRWNRAGNKELGGLTRRRKAEVALWNNGKEGIV